MATSSPIAPGEGRRVFGMRMDVKSDTKRTVASAGQLKAKVDMKALANSTYTSKSVPSSNRSSPGPSSTVSTSARFTAKHVAKAPSMSVLQTKVSGSTMRPPSTPPLSTINTSNVRLKRIRGQSEDPQSPSLVQGYGLDPQPVVQRKVALPRSRSPELRSTSPTRSTPATFAANRSPDRSPSPFKPNTPLKVGTPSKANIVAKVKPFDSPLIASPLPNGTPVKEPQKRIPSPSPSRTAPAPAQIVTYFPSELRQTKSPALLDPFDTLPPLPPSPTRSQMSTFSPPLPALGFSESSNSSVSTSTLSTGRPLSPIRSHHSVMSQNEMTPQANVKYSPVMMRTATPPVRHQRSQSTTSSLNSVNLPSQLKEIQARMILEEGRDEIEQIKEELAEREREREARTNRKVSHYYFLMILILNNEVRTTRS